MSHALIIDDNIVVSCAIQARLVSLGFSSFEVAWTEAQAIAAAARRAPELVVIGDHVETGSAIDAARQISETLDIPVLMVTSDPYLARTRGKTPCVFEGPFLLNQMPEALRLARTKARSEPGFPVGQLLDRGAEND